MAAFNSLDTNDLIHEGIATNVVSSISLSLCPDTNDLIHEGIATLPLGPNPGGLCG